MLLDSLYNFTEQLYLINTIKKKTKVSEPTYSKFLQKFLPDEHILHKKNRFFASKLPGIKELVAAYPNQPETQFKHLPINTKLPTTLDDYKFFLDKYYFNDTERVLERKPLNRFDINEKVLNFESPEKYKIVTTKADTIYDIISAPVKSVSPGNTPKVAKAKKNGKFLVYATKEAKAALFNAEGFLKIKLVKGASLQRKPELFKIVDDRDKFPSEILNSKFLYADFDTKDQKFNEDFIYFTDSDFIQYADPESYGLMDNLLFVCGTVYENNMAGYLLYRYYQGKIYFIENLKFPNGSITIRRTFGNWLPDNTDGDFYNFTKKYLDNIAGR